MSSCAFRRLPSCLSREGPRRRPVHSSPLDDLLLRNRALARTLARARVGLRPLAAHRQVAAVAPTPGGTRFPQPLFVSPDLPLGDALPPPPLPRPPSCCSAGRLGQILC